MPKFVASIMSASRVVTLVASALIASCSFQSRQLDFVKSTWQDRFSKADARKSEEVFWWDFNYAGNTYRLFPLSWKGSTALTDGKRWIVVLQENRIQLVRDLVARRDLAFSFTAYTRRSNSKERDISIDGFWLDDQQSGDLDENLRYREIVRMSSSATGQKSDSTELKCGVPAFDFKQLLRVTNCIDEEGDLVEFNVVKLDRNREPLKIIQGLDERNWIELSRSGTRVNEQELRRFLNE